MKYIAIISWNPQWKWESVKEQSSIDIAHGDDLNQVQKDVRAYINKPTLFALTINSITIYDISGKDRRIVYCFVIMANENKCITVVREGFSLVDACSKLPDEYASYRPKDYSGII